MTNVLDITAAEVMRPLGYGEDDLDSLKPDGTALTARIRELCGELASPLRAIGVDPDSLTADASDAKLVDLYQRCRGGVKEAALGWWHAKNQHEDSSLAQAAVAAWRQWLEDFRQAPGHVAGGAQTPEGRSSVTPRVAQRTPNRTWDRKHGFR